MNFTWRRRMAACQRRWPPAAHEAKRRVRPQHAVPGRRTFQRDDATAPRLASNVVAGAVRLPYRRRALRHEPPAGSLAICPLDATRLPMRKAASMPFSSWSIPATSCLRPPTIRRWKRIDRAPVRLRRRTTDCPHSSDGERDDYPKRIAVLERGCEPFRWRFGCSPHDGARAPGARLLGKDVLERIGDYVVAHLETSPSRSATSQKQPSEPIPVSSAHLPRIRCTNFINYVRDPAIAARHRAHS